MAKTAAALLPFLMAGVAFAPQEKKDPAPLIAAAVRELVKIQEEGGAWPYEGVYRVSGEIPAGYRVGGTALVAGALRFARGQGFEGPLEILERARKCLELGRAKTGAFLYSGLFKEGEPGVTGDQLQGSIARAAICETTILLLGGGSVESIKGALGAFHEHWQALEDRRKKTGTHVGPYKIAPYYFNYAHP